MAALLRVNFASGVLDADITSGATSASSTASSGSSGFAGLPAVSGGDVVYVVLDYDRVAGAPEVVKVTAHTAASATVTISRGQESTTARSHLAGTRWAAAATKAVLEDFITDIAAVDAAAEVAGTSTQFARGDHKHQASVAAPAASAPGDTQAAGTSDSLARADHVHAREAFAVDGDLAAAAAAAAAGTAIKVPRADHVHPFSASQVLRDGSVQFTGLQKGQAGTDPTLDDHLARKAYVDATVAASGLQRLKANGTAAWAGIAGGSVSNPSATQILFQAFNVSSVAVNVSGFITINYPSAFPNGVLAIHLTPTNGNPHTIVATPSTVSVSSVTAFVLVDGSSSLASTSLAACSVIVVGW